MGDTAGKDKFWEELNDSERGAAELLGWSEDTWNDGDPEPMENKFWQPKQFCPAGARALTDEEREAVKILGHTQVTWDHGMNENEAASIVQARVRGRNTRKQEVTVMKAGKTGKTCEPPPKITGEPPLLPPSPPQTAVAAAVLLCRGVPC